MIEINLCLVLILKIILCFSIETKPKLTLDEYFNSTNYPLISISPTGEYLFIQSRQPSWNTNSYENNLWLYNIKTKNKQLITNELSELFKPEWSPSGNWIILLLNQNENISLYSILSNELLSIDIGKVIPMSLTWSNNDLTFYFATYTSISSKESRQVEWKDVIRYRQSKSSEGCSIYRIDIENNNQILSTKKSFVKDIPFLITELLFVPFDERLIFVSYLSLYEKRDAIEIYSLDLKNLSTLSKLTNNQLWEQDIRLSNDHKYILFLAFGTDLNDTVQQRLYSLDLTNGQIERLGKDFHGHIVGYSIKPDDGVYILGQLGTETQIYTQESSIDELIYHQGWNGTYERISISSKRNDSPIALIYSSLERAKEVYLIDNIDQIKSAKPLTNENNLFQQRELPKTINYQWKNHDDQQIIEGILHYPLGKFQSKNLPLFVLIHGGPNSASVNSFNADWYNWAPLAASEGWLVLEPNYRGSIGYGDQFRGELNHQPLSLPGKDILSGVDQLINDGIADPNQLAIGGYSYGGFLTNWLITQTTRFNAAVTGAGIAELLSALGQVDMPVFIYSLFGGYPWEMPETYLNESPISYLRQVRTPTHIITGEKDTNVDLSHSKLLERALHYLGIPVQLLIFPNEGHVLNKNPWHGKIKVHEELEWLHTYGNKSSNHINQ